MRYFLLILGLVWHIEPAAESFEWLESTWYPDANLSMLANSGLAHDPSTTEALPSLFEQARSRSLEWRFEGGIFYSSESGRETASSAYSIRPKQQGFELLLEDQTTLDIWRYEGGICSRFLQLDVTLLPDPRHRIIECYSPMPPNE